MVDSFALASEVDDTAIEPWRRMQRSASQLFECAKANLPPEDPSMKQSPEWHRLVKLARGDTTFSSQFMAPIMSTYEALCIYKQQNPESSSIPVLTHRVSSAQELLGLLNKSKHKVSFCSTTSIVMVRFCTVALHHVNLYWFAKPFPTMPCSDVYFANELECVDAAH